MFRHIMVPLDGSELAEWALPVAEQLAILTGQLAVLSSCTVHLVRVIDMTASTTWTPAIGYLPEDLARSEHLKAQAYLQEMRSRLEADGVQVRTQELTGEVISTLLRYEKEEKIDLVVICSHLRSGVSRMALGSIAERLLRKGSAPVMMVHAGKPTADLQHAIVPLDGSEFAEQALKIVGGLARYVVRRVTLLHVRHEHEEERLALRYLARCLYQLQQYGVQCDYKLLEGDAVQAILELTQSDQLVVMTTHCRSTLSRVAHGSVADQVLHRGLGPVLLTRQWPCDQSSTAQS